MVSRKILESSGPGGMDSEALQIWLIKFMEDITRLLTSLETFIHWLANGSPHWLAYCSFMSIRLIALDKQLGVRMVGVRETWRRLFTNIVLKVTRLEATMACQDDQLCDGLKAGINGVVHGVQTIWDEYLTTEDWGFLLVDAKNTFNEINRVGMLWAVRHLWPSRAFFIFN